METRIFDFDVDFNGPGDVIGHLVLRPPNGNGLIRYFDEILAMGWRPIHWTTLPSELTTVAKYRVVMQRGVSENGARGAVSRSSEALSERA